MRSRLLLAAVLLILTVRARADEWTKVDTGFQAAVVVASAVDWMQTVNFTQRSGCRSGHAALPVGTLTSPCLYEANPFLGARPTRAEVNITIPLSILAHTAVAVLLPQPYRRVWQTVGLAVEVSAVGVNAHHGVRLSLPWN